MSLEDGAAERMVAKYKDLISGFAGRQVSAEDFESTYLTLFKNDKDHFASREFDVIEKLFFAVDDDVADPALRTKVSGSNDEELRVCAEEAYSKLYGV